MKTFYLIFFIITLSNCAHYKYDLKDYDVPVSFSKEKKVNSRTFKIKAKMTYLLFDLINIQNFEMEKELRKNLPNAKFIYNLKIESEEDFVDSLVRFFGTGVQILLVTNRPLISRRTVWITGEVIETLDFK